MEPQSQIRAYLEEGLEQLGLSGSSLDLDKLIAYFEMLLRANDSLNLISSRQDLRTRVAVHLLDSLTPLLWTDWPRSLSALDLGSGGGLPAIPLSLAFPDWELCLVEATGKKTVFLASVKDSLQLANIRIMNKYLEPDKNPEGQLFDLISARGVSDLKKLSAIAGPRLKPGGRLLAFKGPQASTEFAAAEPKLKQWKLKLDDRIDFVLPLVEAKRSLIRLIKC